jgi:hypothetical protein
LAMADFPTDRTYIVYPNEKYDLNHRYFTPSNQAPVTHVKDLEKELRMCYRAGHLDEIKKQHFGKVYSTTRKYYMERELDVVRNKPKTVLKPQLVLPVKEYDGNRYTKSEKKPKSSRTIKNNESVVDGSKLGSESKNVTENKRKKSKKSVVPKKCVPLAEKSGTSQVGLGTYNDSSMKTLASSKIDRAKSKSSSGNRLNFELSRRSSESI